MKRLLPAFETALLIMLSVTVFGSETLTAEQPAADQSPAAVAQRPRTNTVRMVEFNLNDGTAVSGRVVVEGRNQITVEKRVGSTLELATYNKRDIEPRSQRTRAIPGYKYYMDNGEYFSSRTWDFRDDPDDFIQAIRSYEKAKELLAGSGLDDRVAQIDAQLTRLKHDKGVWEREVRSRAELKKLELDATLTARIKNLEKKIDEASKKAGDNSKQLAQLKTDIESNYEQLRQDVLALNDSVTRELQVLRNEVDYARRYGGGAIIRHRDFYYPSAGRQTRSLRGGTPQFPRPRGGIIR